MRGISVLLASGISIAIAIFASAVAVADSVKVMGPNACAECHKKEAQAWKSSHHFKTFRELPRRKSGKTIAKNMGIRRIRAESLCLNCHYTVKQTGRRKRAIAGISCESCHSSGKDWIKVHSEYSGKTKKTETKAERRARLKLADSKGMIRPISLYRLAKNCYSCHVVPKEKLVNTGGHPAGSAFELVSWSQGEVRHNTWQNEGKSNRPAGAKRKRMLYLVGLGVELETSIRAVSSATARSLFAFAMARRVDRARSKLATVAKAVPGVPEIPQLINLAYSAGLKLNNKNALKTAADGVAKLVKKIAATYDGSNMAGLDPMIPKPGKFKGKVPG